MHTPSVAICVPTFQRPRSLESLLQSFLKMDISALRVLLIVADNDPCESARDTLARYSRELRFPVIFISEPTRGLASVRNRLISEALQNHVEFVAFVDDDETVEEQWLKSLVREANRSGATAVMGRQVLWLDDDISENIKQCFQPLKFRTGDNLKYFGTNNLIIRTDSIVDIPGPFDTRLNLTGGEDTMLANELIARGHRIVGCSEAITKEYVPRSRANARWIFQRAFRSGTTRSKVARWIKPSFATTLRHLVFSSAIIAKHGILLIPDVVIRRELLLFRLKCIVSGVGGIAGTLTTKAYSHQEYENIHGS